MSPKFKVGDRLYSKTFCSYTEVLAVHPNTYTIYTASKRNRVDFAHDWVEKLFRPVSRLELAMK